MGEERMPPAAHNACRQPVFRRYAPTAKHRFTSISVPTQARRGHLRLIAVLASLFLSSVVLITADAGESTLTVMPKLEVIQDLPTPGPATGIVWNSDGTKLAAMVLGEPTSIPGFATLPTIFGKLVIIWNADGTVFKQIQREQAFFEAGDNMAFAGGDRFLVTPPSEQSNDLAFSVFDLASGEMVRDVAGPHPDKPHNVNAATRLVTSPDQTILAVSFGRALAQPVALYSTRDWTKIADLPEAPTGMVEEARAIAFSRDGTLIATLRVDSAVLIYDVKSLRLLQKFTSYPENVAASPSGLAISPDSKIIAVINNVPAARLFRLEDGAELGSLNYEKPVSLATSPDWSAEGQILAFVTGVPRALHLWEPFSDRPRARIIELERISNSLAFSPDGRTLALANGRSIRIFGLHR